MSLPSNSGGGGGAGGGGLPHGINLANSVNSSRLPAPDSCCALGENFRRLFAEQQSTGSTSNAVISIAEVSEQLQNTDVSYLNLRDNVCRQPSGLVGHPRLYDEVLRCNSEAFNCTYPGPTEEPTANGKLAESKASENNIFFLGKVYRDTTGSQSHQHEDTGLPSYQHAEVGTQQNDDAISVDDITPRKRKKGKESMVSSAIPDTLEDSAIRSFIEMVKDICRRSEIQNDEFLQLTLGDLNTVIRGIHAIRAKKLPNLVPLHVLSRLLRVLDQRIHRAKGLSVDEHVHLHSEVMAAVLVALESTHTALLLMVNFEMPKQEIITRIVEFSTHQISACLALPKRAFDGDEDEEADEEFGSASKKRRTGRAAKVHKSTASRESAVLTGILQKLCTIVGCIEDLLSVERLSNNCILQLIRTSFATIQVDNTHLLQAKAVNLIIGIYRTHVQHRADVMNEALQTLLKLPLSERVPRTYHLPDEEQEQIQIITALLVQLIHCSAILPDAVRKSTGIILDAKYIPKCHEAITESCCLFWSRVLQRLTGSKNQEFSGLKLMIDNLVSDLLPTLNLPEYPASATILEALCVLLLQNAGLNSKDTSACSMVIDLLGTVAARLKQDAVLCKKEKFWILHQLINDEIQFPGDWCSVCLDAGKKKWHISCKGCLRVFHYDCLAAEGHAVPTKSSPCYVCI